MDINLGGSRFTMYCQNCEGKFIQYKYLDIDPGPADRYVYVRIYFFTIKRFNDSDDDTTCSVTFYTGSASLTVWHFFYFRNNIR